MSEELNAWEERAVLLLEAVLARRAEDIDPIVARWIKEEFAARLENKRELPLSKLYISVRPDPYLEVSE